MEGTRFESDDPPDGTAGALVGSDTGGLVIAAGREVGRGTGREAGREGMADGPAVAMTDERAGRSDD